MGEGCDVTHLEAQLDARSSRQQRDRSHGQHGWSKHKKLVLRMSGPSHRQYGTGSRKGMQASTTDTNDVPGSRHLESVYQSQLPSVLRTMIDQDIEHSSKQDLPICKDCQSIDFDHALLSESNKRQLKNGTGVFLHDLSYLVSNSDCYSCRVFASMKVAPDQTKWCLAAHSARKRFSKYLPDTIILTVDPWPRFATYKTTSFLLPTESRDGLSGLPIGSTVDWASVKSWLEFCTDHHVKYCKPHESMLIPDFRVIDCETRKIVILEDASLKYVTLSYVWGRAVHHPLVEYDMPDQLPRTIEDAISVVKSLGYRYLWVDRYCIPVDNAVEKRKMIESMGLVYENSVITIIATAGEDPTRGLPGVGSTTRTPLPALKVGSQFLTVFSPEDEVTDIQQSKWNTRGWTYQEGLLSRRKLVFTERSVTFQCGGMHCFENLSLPLKVLHTKDLARFREDTALSKPFPARSVGRGHHAIEGRIGEYSLRDFTYSEDVIRAFQGILRRFEMMSHPVRNLLGIPIFAPTSFRPPQNSVTDIFMLGLAWEIRGPATRRHALPSWTWIGWRLDEHSNFKLWADRYTFMRRNTVFDLHFETTVTSVELEDGAIVPWKEMTDDKQWDSGSTYSPTHLHLLGTVFDISLSKHEDVYIDKAWPSQSWAPVLIPDFYQTPLEDSDDVKMTCLIIGHSTEIIFVLLLRSLEKNGTYQRVGSSRLRCLSKSKDRVSVFSRMQATEQIHLRKELLRIC
jgi:hypothetical protein